MALSRRLRVACAAALLAGGGLDSLPGQTDEPERFSETIEVREIEVVFDDDVLPRLGSFLRKKRADYSAFEDGAAYPLVEIGSVSSADWLHVLYFDSGLAGPAARIAAARALQPIAGSLTAGGRAEIVVADPDPRVALVTAIPAELVQGLERIVAQALGEIEAGPGSVATLAQRSLQIDRLAVEIAGRGGGGPRALWLAGDRWPMQPIDHERFARARQKEPADDPQFGPLLAAGKVLASYGWVTSAIAIRGGREQPTMPLYEGRVERRRGGTGDYQTNMILWTLTGSRRHSAATSEAQLDTLTDFALLPLTALSRPTSGVLIGTPERLGSVMGDLHDRRRATYHGPRPEPGSLTPFEVRWTGGDGRLLPSPRFLRSSTPQEVTRARLRLLLAGVRPTAPAGSLTRREVAASPGASEICFGEGRKRSMRLAFARPGFADTPTEVRFDIRRPGSSPARAGISACRGPLPARPRASSVHPSRGSPRISTTRAGSAASRALPEAAQGWPARPSLGTFVRRCADSLTSPASAHSDPPIWRAPCRCRCRRCLPPSGRRRGAGGAFGSSRWSHSPRGSVSLSNGPESSTGAPASPWRRDMSTAGGSRPCSPW